SMPIYLAAGLMFVQSMRRRAINLAGAGAVVVVSAAMLSLVLAMQAWQFGRFHWQFADVLAEAESPVLQLDRIPGIERTPLNHWGSISHALLLQSPEPRVLVIEKKDDLLPLYDPMPSIKFAPFHQLYRDDPANRWLRIGALIERVVGGRPIPEQTLQAD
ncbi:MAG TPA: hypothetical protein PKB10_01435, partial [Tepidisphaeraceae bacterium]|nr:hypothetical protein [Tepidisphaeraceae bacterium]